MQLQMVALVYSIYWLCRSTRCALCTPTTFQPPWKLILRSETGMLIFYCNTEPWTGHHHPSIYFRTSFPSQNTAVLCKTQHCQSEKPHTPFSHKVKIASPSLILSSLVTAQLMKWWSFHFALSLIRYALCAEHSYWGATSRDTSSRLASHWNVGQALNFRTIKMAHRHV